jgi:hypothetical protein
MFTRKCPKCNVELYYKQQSQVVRATQKNSKCASCAAEDKPKNGLHTTCAGCGAPIYKPKSEIRDRNFCSRKCLNSITGEQSPAWKGGKLESRIRETTRVKKIRKKLKQKGVDFLGGKCSNCGYNKCIASLDFHHPDQSQKDYLFSAKYRGTWRDMKAKIKNCILLCANCHREHHYIHGVDYTPRNK